MTDTTRGPISGVRTVGVPVTDQDRALEFYLGILGFEKLMDAPWSSSAGAGSRSPRPGPPPPSR